MHKSAVVKNKETGKFRVVRMEVTDLTVDELKMRQKMIEQQIKNYEHDIKYYQSLCDMLKSELEEINKLIEKEGKIL
ncbi:hypothetical protein O163_08180 [Caldanaerobacter subterraneus subsp. yonseiensis KB-1]|uniref:Uncharacterized protein n=1 Tax=Caldanaerobacter subterraneus subsp. yonseiensis KB-1 TaxID=1388761 RepID=U5CSK3_CALSX|nr:hypothetical protein [Caldanaerobacter subterraneus]ERM91916.1 hypothetical protein O163_08180 [Caldanaerobacter subterraneus subsp. yonseiensis KB-1]